ncbi:MAG: bifunctional pyr operon transcriptional regulator/uracil phosphoribosyltransferase PyrR [Gemmatimonadales bacterium]|nr:MAG: bifunctional pyr operon transcriptional regulator/uracil phosphoribosyltransferase PyrR [Gemmatimonadales bacterium]
MPPVERDILMDADAVERALDRMASEIVERNDGTEGLVLLGIRRRGVELADRLRERIERSSGRSVAFGALDITLYRDDLGTVGPRPVVGESSLPMEGVDDRTVVIVDDVLYTGRTGRAALNELMDWGRPSRVLLCVLVDRGGRELPIQPDIVGRSLRVLPRQTVEVRVPEEDGHLAVEVLTPAEGGGRGAAGEDGP